MILFYYTQSACTCIYTVFAYKIYELPLSCDRDVSGYRIVGSPRCIDDKKYARNAFIFNFVFVFTSSTVTAAYEPIITKIGDTFRTCEVRSYGNTDVMPTH